MPTRPDAPDLFGGDPAPIAPASDPVEKPKRAPTLYPIPSLMAPELRVSHCTGATCDATVYWIPGYRFPVSVNTDAHPECVAPTFDTTGRGVSHFVDCPNRSTFSGRNR